MGGLLATAAGMLGASSRGRVVRPSQRDRSTVESMHSVEHIANGFDRNRNLVHRQADGLSHADSLLQPPFRGNCFNWVLGHIVVHRDKVIRVLDGEPVLDSATTDRYENESNPITEDGPHIVDFARLLSMLDESQSRVEKALFDRGETGMRRSVEIRDKTVPLWKRVDFLLFHDTYHTGQTELLRQLAGVDDKVI